MNAVPCSIMPTHISDGMYYQWLPLPGYCRYQWSETSQTHLCQSIVNTKKVSAQVVFTETFAYSNKIMKIKAATSKWDFILLLFLLLKVFYEGKRQIYSWRIFQGQPLIGDLVALVHLL